MLLRRPTVVMLLCVWLIVGCANTRLSQQPGPVASWQKPAPSTPPAALVSVTLYARQLRFGSPTGKYIGPHWNKRATQRQLDGVLKEFPSFAVETDSTSTPYRLLIEATHATTGRPWRSQISRFTKSIIPCTEEHAIELEGRLFKGGDAQRTYDAIGTYRTRRQLFWLLAPWAWRLGASDETTADTLRDLLLQVERDVVP